MNTKKNQTVGFEFVDIEIIGLSKDKSEPEKWDCNHCSLYFLTQEKLNEHKQKHDVQLLDKIIRCKYCNKTIVSTTKNKVCYANRKCETCEYRCSLCPKRFLRLSSLVNHESNHGNLEKNYKKHLTPTSKNSDCSTQNNDKEETKLSSAEIKNYKNEQVTKKKAPKRNSLVLNNNRKKSLDEEILSTKDIKKRKKSYINKETNSSHVKKNKLRFQKTPKIFSKKKMESKVRPKFLSTPNDHVANYKPFCCHLCGEKYASDSALIEHIKSHGESISAFKCKYCGDEFADVYKMQFHLAVCPLAEDELQSTFVQTNPSKVLLDKINCSSQDSPDIKLKRKKEQEPKISKVHIHTLNEPSTSQTTRRSQRMKSTVHYLAKKSCDGGDSLFIKSEPNSNLETGELKVSSKELNNFPERDPLENIENNLTSQNISHEQSYSTTKDHRIKDHVCPFPRCGMQFSREKALLCHMRNHSDDFDDTNVLKCHKCDIPFDDIYSLRLHVNTCKGIKEDKDDDFNQPDYSGNKTKNRFSNKSRNELSCTTCGRTFKTLEKLNRCRHVNPEKSTIPCQKLGSQLNGDEGLQNNDNSNLVGNPTEDGQVKMSVAPIQEGKEFKCDVCLKCLPSYNSLYFHYRQAHFKNCPKMCKVCNALFLDEEALIDHQKRHKGNCNLICLFCPESFKSNMCLNSHLKKDHPDEKVFKCHICHKPFLDSSLLFKHMLFHATMLPSEKYFQCCICFQTYPEKKKLKAHIENFHIKTSNLNCDVCGAIQRDIKGMSTHLLRHSIKIKQEKSNKADTLKMKRKLGDEKYQNSLSRKEILQTPKSHIYKSIVKSKEKMSDNEMKSARKKCPTKKKLALLGNCKKQIDNSVCSTEHFKKKRLSRLKPEHEGNNDDREQNFKKVTSGKSNSVKTLKNKSSYALLRKGKSCSQPKMRSGIIKTKVKKREIGKKTKNERQPVTGRPLSFISEISSKGNNDSCKKINGSRKSNLQFDDSTFLSSNLEEKYTTDCKPAQVNSSPVKKNNHAASSASFHQHLIDTNCVISHKSRSQLKKNNHAHSEDFHQTQKRQNHVDNVAPHVFIKEEKSFQPAICLSNLRCTTCMVSFSSQSELLLHNTQHI